MDIGFKFLLCKFCSSCYSHEIIANTYRMIYRLLISSDVESQIKIL